jgi:DNA modification methylase
MAVTSKHNQIACDLGPTQLIAVSSLKFPQSFKIYPSATIKKAARFLETFGPRLPVLVDSDRNIVAGEIWALAHQRLGLPEISALFIEGLSADQLQAYRIGIQRIPELGDWDDGALGELFKDWTSRDLEFDVELTGFEMPAIDTLIGNLSAAPRGDEVDDNLEPTDVGPPITQPGDIWIAGRHRILCGSSIESTSFEALMRNEKASVVITDPPYNVAIDGHVGGKGRIHHSEFVMASGEMSGDEFQVFLQAFMGLLAQHSADGSLHYIFMDWRHTADLLRAGEQTYRRLKNIVVWVKSNGGMGSLYRSQHEFVFVFKNGDAPHRNNVQLGRHGRNRTNVWQYAGANGFDGRTTEEGHLLALHPTVKPVQMLADALLDSSARGEIALDPFLGSGSTLIACERVGRRLRGIELDPAYVDVTIRRWQRHTGASAINAATGTAFDDC